MATHPTAKEQVTGVDEWVDRLRQVGAVLDQMSEVERKAAFAYFLDFYGYKIPWGLHAK